MVLALLAVGSCVRADTPDAAPMIPNLSWEKRSDWIDVKTDVTPAAMGDGVADDTDALQAGFKGMKQGSVLYLPAGTYRISRTLLLGGEQSMAGSPMRRLSVMGAPRRLSGMASWMPR